jgi:hypothetical protein
MLDTLLHLPSIYFQTCEHVLKGTSHNIYVNFCQSTLQTKSKTKIKNKSKSNIFMFQLC